MEAQCSFLNTILCSNDVNVKELHPLLQNSKFRKSIQLTEDSFNNINEAKHLLANNSKEKSERERLRNALTATLAEKRREKWNCHLNKLTVQRSLLTMTVMEEVNPIWQRMSGMQSSNWMFTDPSNSGPNEYLLWPKMYPLQSTTL